MTCTYDGRLLTGPMGIEPCCADLHALVVTGQIYLGKVTSKGGPTLMVPKLRTGDKAGRTISCCPCCGATAEVHDSTGSAVGGDRKITIRITQEELDALDAFAARQGITRSEVIRRAIRQAIGEGRA